ncbi:MAG: hypothetical protein ACREH8_22435 [Opitutaceae bacterium]
MAAALAIAIGMRAQETPSNARSTSAAPNALSDAKKDFENLKSARDAALLPKGGLPQVDLPSSPAQPRSAPLASPATKPKTDSPNPKSGNWLVDAMEKQDNARDARGQNSRIRDRRSQSSLQDKDPDGVEQDGREIDASRTGKEDNGTPVVINPLARYLDDWMTPQDYALLKPGLTQTFDPRPDTSNSALLNSGDLAGLPGGLNESLFGGVPASHQAPAASRENPFLQSLKPELPATTPRLELKPVAPTLHASQPAMTAPPVTPPAQTKIPEFAKPGTDEKHFKQLKRF